MKTLQQLCEHYSLMNRQKLSYNNYEYLEGRVREFVDKITINYSGTVISHTRYIGILEADFIVFNGALLNGIKSFAAGLMKEYFSLYSNGWGKKID